MCVCVCVCECVCVRERDRDREGQRGTDRQKDRAGLECRGVGTLTGGGSLYALIVLEKSCVGCKMCMLRALKYSLRLTGKL